MIAVLPIYCDCLRDGASVYLMSIVILAQIGSLGSLTFSCSANGGASLAVLLSFAGEVIEDRYLVWLLGGPLLLSWVWSLC
jgi:hypothetical protein